MHPRHNGDFSSSGHVLNHPNYDLIYNTSSTNYAVSSATFGKVTHASDPRLIQLALKLRF